jgi:hypothetical protein
MKLARLYRKIFNFYSGVLWLTKYLWSVNPIVVLFGMNLIFCELFLLDIYLARCSFPVLGNRQYNSIIIADPQLTDHYSYKQYGILLKLTEFYSDIYMKRNYRRILRRYNPEMVIFAGDLFDGGREWSDDDFSSELTRFNHIFWSEKPALGVPGNHDIGFGLTLLPYAYSR